MACIDLSLTEETHEGQRNSVWNSSSRRQCRRRGRRLQHRPEPLAGHDPTRTGTKYSESASGPGRKQVEVEMSKTRWTAAASSRTTSWPWPDKNLHEGQRICVGNRSQRRHCRRRSQCGIAIRTPSKEQHDGLQIVEKGIGESYAMVQ